MVVGPPPGPAIAVDGARGALVRLAQVGVGGGLCGDGEGCDDIVGVVEVEWVQCGHPPSDAVPLGERGRAPHRRPGHLRRFGVAV